MLPGRPFPGWSRPSRSPVALAVDTPPVAVTALSPVAVLALARSPLQADDQQNAESNPRTSSLRIIVPSPLVAESGHARSTLPQHPAGTQGARSLRRARR